MAIKKSDLYSSIWASCDELRGGMDASQYKDYVLFMLFIKYITDKYGSSSDFAPPVTIPKCASFKDMIALKGKSDIGDKINTQIIQPLIDALRGSLYRFNAIRGTIIATAPFSKGTSETAFATGAAPITLIDGDKLIDLLIEHGIGVKKNKIEVLSVDADAFADLEPEV